MKTATKTYNYHDLSIHVDLPVEPFIKIFNICTFNKIYKGKSLNIKKTMQTPLKEHKHTCSIMISLGISKDHHLDTMKLSKC